MTTAQPAETARALLYRHGLPEDVIDGVLALHAQELAEQIRSEPEDLETFEGMRQAAALIDPTKPSDASPAQPVEAHPPHHRWYVETRDGVADQWAPGMRFTERAEAVERYQAVTANFPTWTDGTPVERRFVRETTTYTVEEPAPVSQQPAAAYSDGKGRVYCLACASKVAADVPLTVEDVDHWELCPSCGRHVIDVARAEQQPTAADTDEERPAETWTCKCPPEICRCHHAPADEAQQDGAQPC